MRFLFVEKGYRGAPLICRVLRLNEMRDAAISNESCIVWRGCITVESTAVFVTKEPAKDCILPYVPHGEDFLQLGSQLERIIEFRGVGRYRLVVGQ
jgi:hypothetical protein